ncbi:MAG TPA: acetolactate decarboxylase [Flavobacteriales bacterium]|nr:acetolactate decarboxylase [Flavobacteriales bacterium]
MFARFVTFVLAVLLIAAGQAQNNPVVPTGAMRNTMFNGQLAGLIQLDSIAKPGTYGIGPVEYLRGELMLWDGHAYRSTAQGDSAMVVVEAPESKAPFFVHQHVREWTEVPLPDSVADLGALDAFLTARFGAAPPFSFKLHGVCERVDLHIVDVSSGTVVHGPDDAHRENKHFHLDGRNVDLLGFYSTRHQAVFTHHDTHIHVHAITAVRDAMGHVEELAFDPRKLTLVVAVDPAP